MRLFYKKISFCGMIFSEFLAAGVIFMERRGPWPFSKAIEHIRLFHDVFVLSVEVLSGDSRKPLSSGIDAKEKNLHGRFATRAFERRSGPLLRFPGLDMQNKLDQ